MIRYISGDDVRVGDVVRINSERIGKVLFVVLDETSVSDPYYFRSLGVGAMIDFEGWGSIYYSAEQIGNEEDLYLVKRA